MLIPYLDYKKEGVGIWFYSKRGKNITILTTLLTLLIVPPMIYYFPILKEKTGLSSAPQWLSDISNPATLLSISAFLISFILRKKTTTREAMIFLFTAFIMTSAILTIIGVFFRCPNWSWVWPWKSGIYYHL